MAASVHAPTDVPPSVIPIAPAAGERPARGRRRGAARGRAVEPQALVEVQALLGDEPLRRDRLIEYLHRVQDRHGRLAARHLVALGHLLRLAPAEVFEVASFYHHFDVVDDAAADAGPAPLAVRVCDGLPCMLAGARDLLEGLPAVLGDAVRVVAAPCVGRCETAPVAVVHQHPVAPATADGVRAAVREGRSAAPAVPALGLDGYVAAGGYRLLRELVEGRRDIASVIDALEHAGLRGLGGAGFPAARKWRIVRAQPAPRLMAVNADEGEPGTFKDRVLLETDPHRVLEGMFVAARAVGAEAVYFYLRDEYHGIRALLEAELARLRAAPPVPGLPAVELRRGAGAYVCGEESAMLESIEGRRGMPRLRPPYVAEVGLFGRPTLVHNVETLAWVRELVEQGPQAFAAQGRHGRRGMRRFSVSGRVRSPGVKLAPAGITLRELVDEHCGGLPAGHELYAWLPGGASGGILPASLADLPLDFDTLQPHGAFIGSAAIVVLTRSATHVDRAADAARHLMRFFEHESCGQCTPCRVGTAKASLLMARPVWDAALLTDLSRAMRDASICGLGQAAPNPVDHVLRHFAHEVGLGPRDA
ncbi:MAG: NAD(P)H-dependent oxidoreductase subunit E [Rubrivivax sp.]|jgi:formate dehydrogenase|nr:NAD(P)H-dependent oxidoreductase subunit E [Rubrivivax sp.]